MAFAATATTTELTDDQLKSLFEPDDDVASILRPLQERLLIAVNRVVGVLRWRFARPGPPARPLKFEFSLDGTKWSEPWWGLGSLSLPYFVAHDAPPAKVRETAVVIESGAEAPLAWELFYEALALQSSSARAAFLLAITAAEVGIKEFGGRRSSSERWLLDEIPSPPMEKLVGGYLAAFIRVEVSTKKKQPQVVPDWIQNELTGAATKRNKLVHSRKGFEPEYRPTEEHVRKLLACVMDLLYVLDWFAGEDWAFGLLSEETASCYPQGASSRPALVPTPLP